MKFEMKLSGSEVLEREGKASYKVLQFIDNPRFDDHYDVVVVQYTEGEPPKEVEHLGTVLKAAIRRLARAT